MEVQLRTLLTSVLEQTDWSSPRKGRIAREKQPLVSYE